MKKCRVTLLFATDNALAAYVFLITSANFLYNEARGKIVDRWRRCFFPYWLAPTQCRLRLCSTTAHKHGSDLTLMSKMGRDPVTDFSFPALAAVK
jgi:hypothetical protein